MIRTLAALLATSTCIVALATPAAAQTREYNIPAGSLKSALDAYVRQSGQQVVYRSDEVRSAHSPGARGALSAEAALANLLTGSGFTTRVDGKLVAIVRGGNGSIAAGNGPGEGGLPSSNEDVITVTGTRIRGVTVASPIISVTRDEMANAGQTDVGQVVRSIPQSFTGGQNPGVVSGTPGIQNQNFNASSTINLRGLGADATLTLINGHRVAYDGASQAVDISAIPLAAVDRLEVITDGASAIYGSDAVAGVANVILRKDFEGLAAEARIGAATEGGYFQQQYSLVGGARWSSGGFMAAYNYVRDTDISAGQRDITSAINETTTLLPYQRQHSGIFTGHQALSPKLDLVIDATYNWRANNSGYADTTTQPYQYAGSFATQDTESFSIAPKLDWNVSKDWRLSLQGLYGDNRSDFNSFLYANGAAYLQLPGYYKNETRLVELNAEGSLIRLPAGTARIAMGGGYRRVGLHGYGRQETPTSSLLSADYDRSLKSKYAYAELFVPIVSPALAVAAVSRLEATAAVRYEDYGSQGALATPKLGLIYAPVSELTLRGTWGKSFKTPTLYQLYTGYRASLLSASMVGTTNAPPGSTVLLATGGNPDLKAEKATNWTIGAEFKPRWLPGLSIEGSYFDIRYRNRINTPGIALSNILTNPLFSDVITGNPAVDLVSSLAAGSRTPLNNVSGLPFDPSKVIAFIDGRYLNVSRQDIHGVDIQLRYSTTLASGDRILVSGSTAYLSSNQKLLAQSDAKQLAGVLYNPPHWRARGGGTWSHGSLNTSLFVNYVGSVMDNSATPFVKVRGMTTADAVVRLAIPSDVSAIGGMTFGFAINNIWNTKPAVIRETDPRQPPYDSTNYSVIGRTISLSVSTRW
ncbi:TonB-dependent receptor [Sphingobium sp. AS12]|uniref:TonB-dependent receptor n=1 Tax=Sphingobium sp. AS12 TaxID=2849495 RepID=UPI001C3197B4|nr:TonB-dependent receptor [Sphingobium sp. AS12]MBV2147529.1 TonB-dependent receptor [Sphingobium sp. AS12]